MTIKDQLLHILEKSRATELVFLSNLNDEDKGEISTYERWSAKDNVAHANYWAELRAAQAHAWIQGEEFKRIPQYEQANVEVFKQFAESSWEEVEAFAGRTHTKMVETIQSMDEDALGGPSAESEDRKMWDSLVGVAYTHKLTHYAQYYEQRDRKEEVGRLWKEWADLVSPLDDGPDWQGGVHYNAACSLALVGDREGALEELKLGLALRPGLKGWSRLDSDLAILHEDPAYKELFAPAYWWEALEAENLDEALADQFLRVVFMFRDAINSFPESSWREGETLYLRPASLALHIAQTIDFFTALKVGEGSDDPLTQISWQDRDSSKLPTQTELLQYLDLVEERQAKFLVKADFQAQEELFPWTGRTILSRALYSLRHAQHHLADLAMELKRRGFNPPNWQ